MLDDEVRLILKMIHGRTSLDAVHPIKLKYLIDEGLVETHRQSEVYGISEYQYNNPDKWQQIYELTAKGLSFIANC